jgi:hypothetical protein
LYDVSFQVFRRESNTDLFKPQNALDMLPATEFRLIRQRSDTFEGKQTLAPLDKAPETLVSLTPEIRKSKSLTKKIKTLRENSRNDSPALVDRSNHHEPTTTTGGSQLEKISSLSRSASNSSPLVMRPGLVLSDNILNFEKLPLEKDSSTSNPISSSSLSESNTNNNHNSGTNTDLSSLPLAKLTRENSGKSLLPSANVISSTISSHSTVKSTAPAHQLSAVKPTNTFNIVDKKISIQPSSTQLPPPDHSDDSHPYVQPLHPSHNVFHHFSLPKSVASSTSTATSLLPSATTHNKSVASTTPKSTTHKSLQGTPSSLDIPIESLNEKFLDATKSNEKTSENDRILMERLSQAKALQRKEGENGAVMHKFSLWAKKPAPVEPTNTNLPLSSTPFKLDSTSEEGDLKKEVNSLSSQKTVSRVRAKITREQNYPSHSNTNDLSPLEQIEDLSPPPGELNVEKEKVYIEENSLENADLSFLQDRSNLDISVLGGSSLGGNDSYDMSNLGNSYSDDEFVKEDDMTDITNQHANEVSLLSIENSSIVSGNKGMASQLRNKVVVAKAMHLIESPIGSKPQPFVTEDETVAKNSSSSGAKALKRLDFSSFHEVEIPDETEHPYSSFTNKKTSSGGLNPEKTTHHLHMNEEFIAVEEDGSSHDEEEGRDTIDRDDEESYIEEDSLLIIHKTLGKSRSFNNLEITDSNASVHTIFSKSGPLAFPSSSSMNSRSSEISSDLSSHNQSGHPHSAHPHHTDKIGRAISEQIVENSNNNNSNAHGIAYEESISMVRSLTSREQPRDKSQNTSSSNSSKNPGKLKSSIAASKDEEGKDTKNPSVVVKEKTRNKSAHNIGAIATTPSSSSSSNNPKKQTSSYDHKAHGNNAHIVPASSLSIEVDNNQHQAASSSNVKTLQPSRSTEKLSKYQKLKSLRTAKKQKGDSHSKTSGDDKNLTPVEKELLSKQAQHAFVPILSNSRDPNHSNLTEEILKDHHHHHHHGEVTTDREENNSSPMLSEISDEGDILEEIMNEENRIPNIGKLVINPSISPTLNQQHQQPHHRREASHESLDHLNHSDNNINSHSHSHGESIDLLKLSQSISELSRANSPINFIKGEVIGEGTFGKVFKGLNEKTGELLAIKQFFLADGSVKEVDDLQREINVMWELNHENIVR